MKVFILLITILSLYFLSLVESAPKSSVNEIATTSLWFADEENIAPAVEVEAEPEQSSSTSSSIEVNIFNEDSCLRTGGSCLPQIECPHGKLSSEKGLCPQQQRYDVECCHGLSLKETRCHKRGGQCIKATSCSTAVVEERAEDCPEETVCCVLVQRK